MLKKSVHLEDHRHTEIAVEALSIQQERLTYLIQMIL